MTDFTVQMRFRKAAALAAMAAFDAVQEAYEQEAKPGETLLPKEDKKKLFSGWAAFIYKANMHLADSIPDDYCD